MATRTTRSQVTFNNPFVLAEVDGPLAAGIYDIDTDEEIFEGNDRTVYVRTATVIQIRKPGMTRAVTIDPSGLASALQRDVVQSA